MDLIDSYLLEKKLQSQQQNVTFVIFCLLMSTADNHWLESVPVAHLLLYKQ